MSPPVNMLKEDFLKVHTCTWFCCKVLFCFHAVSLSLSLSLSSERPRLGEVRMYPQTNSPSGIAELSYDSSASSNGSRSWSRICVTGSDSGNQYTADTFCTQLGYSGASSFSSV